MSFRKFIILLILPISIYGQVPIEQTLRDEILNNEFDDAQIYRFQELTYGVANPSPVVVAYQAVADAFMARAEWNPYTKIVYLRKSQSKFDSLISKHPENLEIRFLRFSTQAGIPEILGFSKNMSGDKDFIVTQLEIIDHDEIDDKLFNFMVDFISTSKHCTSKDFAMLQKSKKKRFG